MLYLITKSNFGGAQRYVFDLATHIPRERFEPVVAAGSEGPLLEKLRQAGVRIVTLPSLTRDVSIFADLHSFFAVVRLLKRERPDVLHLNSSKAAGLGALAGRLIGVPMIIFTVHGWPFLENRSAGARAFIWLFSWITALLSHRVICVSGNDLRHAQRMLVVRHKACCIHNGIDQSMRFGSGEIIRSAFPTGAWITGTIGELTRNKNQSALIGEALHTGGMYVAIVGEGEDRDKLQDMIDAHNLNERVKLFGYIPAQEVLKGFDVFALPSLKEGLPYVLLEAKLAGLPIKAHRVGGVGEILDGKIKDFSLDRMVRETIAVY